MGEICKIHDTFKAKYKNRWICKKCEVEKVALFRANRQIKLKKLLGSKCSICGYDKSIRPLDFHHLDENDKQFGVGAGETRSFIKMLKEIEKCILICANCHNEVHVGLHSKKYLYSLKNIEFDEKLQKERKPKIINPVHFPQKERLLKTCEKHGLTLFSLEGNKRPRYRCVKCRANNLIERRKKMRMLLLNELGARCSNCSYDKCMSALEFHHIDKKSKKIELSAKNMRFKKEILLEEIVKCKLLCKNCHRENHADD